MVRDAAAKEIEPGSIELVEIESIAYQVCDGFENLDCLVRMIEKNHFHASAVQKNLPDGSYLFYLTIMDANGDTFTGFFDMDGHVMSNSERIVYESAGWHRFHAEFGKVSPELAAELANLEPSMEIPVVFWLVSPGYSDSFESTENPVNESLWREPQNNFIQFAIGAGIFEDALVGLVGLPAVKATLSVNEIRLLARYDKVATTYRYKEPENEYCAYQSVWDESANMFSTSGDGFPVCVIEPRLPNSTAFLYSAGEYYTGSGALYDDHAELVCAMIRNSYPSGSNGVSNTASCYFANWAGTPSGNISDPTYYGCLLNAPYVWNYSYTSSNADDRFFDYWADHWPYPLIVASAGNNGASAVSSRGYNMMIVNQVDNNATVSRSDDRLARSCSSSSYFTSFINPTSGGSWNPTGDRELPMISAPGYAAVLGDYCAGTSCASPVVAGAAATILDNNNALAGKPWALRAILMAGASNDVALTWFDPKNAALDERDGAGAVDIWLSGLIGNSLFRVSPGNSIPIALGHDYQTLNLSTGFDANGYAYNKYYIDGNTYGAPIRVVLAWNASATCTDASLESSCSESHIDADLNLIVKDVSTDVVVAYSDSFDNSFEFVQFTPPSGDHEYEVSIYKASATESSTRYGIAWVVWPFVDNDVN